MAIEDKATLQAALDALNININGDGPDKSQQEFITDGVGVISTSVLRRMWNILTLQSQNQFDSYIIQRRKLVVINAPSVIFNAADIDENLIYVSDPVAGQVITLPELTADIDEIEITIITLSQNLISLFPFAGDIVFGDQTTKRDGTWKIRATSLGWLALFRPFAERNRAHVFENANALVTVLPINTWTPINCVLGLSPGEQQFTLAGNTLTYTGIFNFSVEYTLSVSGMRTGGGGQFRDVAVGPMVNGNDPTNAIGSAAVNRDDNKNISVTGILPLTPGDTVQPGIINTESAEDMQCSEVSLLLKGW